MKLAVVGSRSIYPENIGQYIPEGVTEIVSGGAKGADSAAADYARANGIKLTEFLPEYDKYGKGAPLKRNHLIAEHADAALAFWDGSSRGTKYTIDLFKRLGKPVKILKPIKP
jgi:predicted Rossmann fold nucleotide-binding protein DprA/Smf involved in DNA uptake